MPLSITAVDDNAREDYLRAFVTTYLAEEIRAEGLVRNLVSFSRFLDVAALAAGQTTNFSAISRDAGVSRETARGYWATPSGGEVDLVWWRGAAMVAIDVKAGSRYRQEYCAGIRSLKAGFSGTLHSWVIIAATKS